MMEKYKKDKFGGLGMNMNKDWTERQKIYNKVKNFENSIAKNFNKRMKELSIRKKESPQKVESMRKKLKIMNSKRFMAQKYGKGVMLNKIREKKRKEKEEIKKKEEEEMRIKKEKERIDKEKKEKEKRKKKIIKKNKKETKIIKEKKKKKKN